MARTSSAVENGRPVWRAVALCVVGLALAAQAAAIALGTGGRLWPFLRYAMYAQGGGNEFSHRDLCVRTAAGAKSVDHRDLAVPRWRFDRLLSVAAADGPNAAPARDLLSRQVARMLGPHTRLEVWTRSYTMGSDGLVDARPPWVLERDWPAVPTPSVARVEIPEVGEPYRLRADTCS